MKTVLTNKEKYRKLCEEKPEIPLFMQSWWMDAVCENNWDVLIYERNSKIIGVWVYHFVEKMTYKMILQPQLTQMNGLWIDYPMEITLNSKISLENEIMSNLILQMSTLKFSYIDQNFQPYITNWLPFYWKKYEQTTRYTYRINDISNPDKCFQEFKTSKRTHINKAKKNLTIDYMLSGEDFYILLENSLKTSKQKVIYTKEKFLNIYNASITKNQGCIIAARDTDQNVHAALFVVWDSNITYNLISMINPLFRNSGGSSLVFWEAIKFAATKSKIFDFEGSMNKNIEKSFREFGSVQVPYFRITRNNSLSFKTLLLLKQWL